MLTGFDREESYIDVLLSEYEGRIPSAWETAVSPRVLLLKAHSGIGIDIALGGMPFEALTIQRATEAEYLPGISLLTRTAEDLIIHKAFASRPKDWVDIKGILIRQRVLDWKYIEEQLKPLIELKEESEIWNILEKLRKDSKK